MKLSELIFEGEYLSCDTDLDDTVEGVFVHAEDLCDGGVLIIPSDNRDVNIALLKAAPKVVICGANTVLPHNIPTLRVENPRIAYANVFYRHSGFNASGITMIGVTGTNGKTTTATLIEQILTECGTEVGFIGTGRIAIRGRDITPSSYSMTTPDPHLLYPVLRRMKDEGCHAIVMEVSSHALSLSKLAPLRFDYGIFTNMSAEHLDFHRNMESYYQAKKRLFDISGCGIFNIDEPYSRRAMNECAGRKISVGIVYKANVWATIIESRDLLGTEYIYCDGDSSFKVSLPLPGSYNVYNSLMAAAVCIDMGCKPREVKAILSSAQPPSGRYEVIKNKITVIIDYAHTPYALENILKDINSIQKADQKLTVVFGCGGERDAEKRPAMAKIAERYADYTYVTADNSRNENTLDIIDDIIKGFEGNLYEIIPDRKNAIRYAIISAGVGDIVAIIGKGSEKYNIDKNGCQPFNENEIIKEAIRDRS